MVHIFIDLQLISDLTFEGLVWFGALRSCFATRGLTRPGPTRFRRLVWFGFGALWSFFATQGLIRPVLTA